MCNLYTQTRSPDEIARLFRELGMPLGSPEGVPNLAPRDICITDPGPIVRASTPARAGVQSSTDNVYELVVRRWSWPGPGGKPVYNFRSDGREFPADRCLIIADGFYEYTTAADPRQKRKDRWRFSDASGGALGIAGLLRDAPGIGQAFTMLTTPPGPDVAPYHHRGVAVIPPADWRAWLDHSARATELIRPLPEGFLRVEDATVR